MFDAKFLSAYMHILPTNSECTKVMMKITNPGLRSGLASSIEDVLNVKVPNIKVDYTKWGVPELSEKQKEYICNDVVYLNELYEKLATKMTPLEWGVYQRARRIIYDKITLDTMGYEDLLNHRQEAPGVAMAKREWFLDKRLLKGD